MLEPTTPCTICNDFHAGMTEHAKGHLHSNKEGIGFVRQNVFTNGDSRPEFCWRCSCKKSGYRNVANEILETCSDKKCPCHVENQAR